MKKRFMVILLCAMLIATCLSALSCKDVPDTPTPTPTPTPQPTMYDKLSELIKVEYNTLDLTVATAVGEDLLTSTFKVVKTADNTTVDYETETLAEIDLDDGTTSRINKQKGSCVVKDGKIVQRDGQNCDVQLDEVATNGGFRFDKSYFSDEIVTEGSFKAKITDFQSFSGKNITVTAAETEIVFTAQAITSIKIVYTTATATVTATYILG